MNDDIELEESEWEPSVITVDPEYATRYAAAYPYI